MKKLRRPIKKLGWEPPVKIMYFHAGEYGGKLGRPHYHACLFGVDFPDRKFHSRTDHGQLDTSEILSGVWGKGFTSVGNVTFKSAAYVARYIIKKVNGDNQEHYENTNLETGEWNRLESEYTTMSRRPGIGYAWFNNFKNDAFPKDFLTHNGSKFKPPKYYDRLFEEIDKEVFQNIKDKRIKSILHEQNTPARLAQREAVKMAQADQLKRKL